MTRRADWPVLRHLFRETQKPEAPHTGVVHPFHMAMRSPLFEFDEVDQDSRALSNENTLASSYDIRLPFDELMIMSSVLNNRGSVLSFCSQIWMMPADAELNPFDEDSLLVVHYTWTEETPDDAEEVGMFFFGLSWVPSAESASLRDIRITPKWMAQIDKFGDEIRDFLSYLRCSAVADIIRVAKLSENTCAAVATPKAEKKGRKAKFREPWRRDDLPRVVLLKPGATSDILGNKVRGAVSDEEKVVAAHRRRGHYRTLRAPRFKKRQGDRVWVRPSWVGPREWVWSGVTYKVHDGEKD